MINARYIHELRGRLENDPEYREARCGFYEAYGWLEGYWREQWRSNGFESFCRNFGPLYWEDENLRDLAGELACEGPVGNSARGYVPTNEVVAATFHLLNESKVVSEDDRHRCVEAARNRCRRRREEEPSEWNSSSFHAMMLMIRQIRNNLFHGRKMEIERIQYERNKRLVTLARDITELLLSNLERVEY
jgi:hypothetical protein